MDHIAASSVAFIFDCDGTLVNSTPVWAYAQPELLHRHGIDVTVDDFAQFEHLSLEDECQAYHDTWGIGANGEELYRELSDILIVGYSKVPPREGLLAFLKQAKAAGVAMCDHHGRGRAFQAVPRCVRVGAASPGGATRAQV